MRGPQDYGGLPAGLVDPVKNEHEPTHWERRVDAIMLLLFDPKRRLARVDESRRMQEALGDDYHKYPYYERWLQAITWLLLEKGVFTQEELDKKLTIPNRGVKQAGFYVLSGASMPCVLIESGFVSNPSEERNLKSPSYRKKIAEGIYQAVVKFKSSREKILADE
mgnify:CR=1 FL=1